MTKLSIKASARDAKREDARARAGAMFPALPGPAKLLSTVKSADSFINFAHKLGVGADNILTSGTYGYNPITRNRIQLEWIHRGSWLGGQAVDVVADDMTRAGVDFMTEMDPADQEEIEHEASTLGIWDKMNEAVKWGRLYGGAIAVLLIDGQDPKTPLRLETVGPDQFKGLAVLDRWMLEPSLEDLVTEYGPHLGLPRFYKVTANAPALRGQSIHHSRVAARFIGIQLPYQQAMTENLWGISVLERLYDRMIAFDSASTGAAQLVFKSHLRTLKIPDLREIVASGGKIMEGLLAYTDTMRRFQGVEGITLIDGEDEFDVQSSTAFSGMDAILTQLGQQISGALQIPMTRLFGQAPGGLSTDDESGMRNYYDGIQQQQRRLMSEGINTTYKLLAASKRIKLPPNFALDFSSLITLDDVKRADVAAKVAEAIKVAFDAGLITQQVAMKELRQSSRTTGIFTNISAEDIEAADAEVAPPVNDLETQLTLLDAQGQQQRETLKQQQQAEDTSLPGDEDDGEKTRPNRKAD